MAYTKKETAIAKLKEGKDFKDIHFDNFRDNREIVLLAVYINGMALAYASDELKEDKEVAMVAIEQCGYAASCVSEFLKDNKDVAMLAVSKHSTNLNHLSERMRDNDDVVNKYLLNGTFDGSFQYISQRLRDNKEFIKKAIKHIKDPYDALTISQHMGANSKSDLDIVKSLVSLKPSAIYHANWNIIENKELLLEIYKQEKLMLKFLTPRMRDDKDIALLNIEGYPFLSNRLKNDRDIALAVVRNGGPNLLSLENKFKNDIGVVFEAVKNDPRSIRYASQEIQNMCKGKDPVVALQVMMNYENVMNSIGSTINSEQSQVRLQNTQVKNKLKI